MTNHILETVSISYCKTVPRAPALGRNEKAHRRMTNHILETIAICFKKEVPRAPALGRKRKRSEERDRDDLAPPVKVTPAGQPSKFEEIWQRL